ncbi:hypothetical protein PV10_06428 [Exophiala mesophila]|uniref:Myb-like DNA-binding domain-containing protein n=1 Tax=Exophiala mesophila TaxID=212818 RepID=A0A0D1XUQ1_EXOME|nr:uncharacterized protein PV10_06428 [Exophiala mesophila]KIV91941.1 hypothetical protein PV10_06428 [Exophiala mesophila]
MAALRRGKNHASDPLTPVFLYSILKQLDLKPIDWQAVADQIGISNGHAARMRYSRMKSQLEGIPPPPKVIKPKKTADTKTASKDKTAGKRQLLAEEEERLSKDKDLAAGTMSTGPTVYRSKRAKIEDDGHALLHSAKQATSIKHEAGVSQNPVAASPKQPKPEPHQSSIIVKQEPRRSVTAAASHSTGIHVKQELDDTIITFQPSASPHPIVKHEIDVGTAKEGSAHFTGNQMKGPLYDQVTFKNMDLNAASNDEDASHEPWPTTMNNMVSPYIHNAIPAPASSQMMGYGHLQGPFHPPTHFDAAASADMNMCPPMRYPMRPVADYFATPAMPPYTSSSYVLDPNAMSYLDMLNMPLYPIPSTISGPGIEDISWASSRVSELEPSHEGRASPNNVPIDQRPEQGQGQETAGGERGKGTTSAEAGVAGKTSTQDSVVMSQYLTFTPEVINLDD